MKPSTQEIEIAQGIVKVLAARNFMSVLNRPMFEWYEENDDLIVEGYEFASGCTKVVVLHPSLANWVIKFPADGGHWESRVKRFTVEGEEPCSDYCAQEVKNYERAVEFGYAEYFAASYKLMDCEGTAVYIQERASCSRDECDEIFFNSASSSVDKEEFEDEDDYYSYVNDIVDEFTDDEAAEAMFGTVVHDGLIDFMNDYCITDLHAGNFGFIGERPVMVDYSGY